MPLRISRRIRCVNCLTSRYFTDFAGSWLAFLNSIHWKRKTPLRHSTS
ncbi:hypothetical protein DMI70_18295 [Escherichia coli]|nr:hypothetical protein [Escherichia coli]